MTRPLLAALALAGALVATSVATSTAEAQAATQTASEGVVNVNTASPEQLMRVPGIGAVRAEAIINARERRPFRRTRELIVRVHGIGRATYRRIERYLTVEGPTTLGE